ncbi:Uncharacterized protein dnm_068160 [Desulfonema magnum]|uniref:Uncharacterized protein n=1 Tax=Desulfonema magnum TaxID=45655 RepID=A0A975BSF6_9BACT|nr:Uncharacterized protein dnm_068160 [Desulfonema magnum]
MTDIRQKKIIKLIFIWYEITEGQFIIDKTNRSRSKSASTSAKVTNSKIKPQDKGMSTVRKSLCCYSSVILSPYLLVSFFTKKTQAQNITYNELSENSRKFLAMTAYAVLIMQRPRPLPDRTHMPLRVSV